MDSLDRASGSVRSSLLSLLILSFSFSTLLLLSACGSDELASNQAKTTSDSGISLELSLYRSTDNAATTEISTTTTGRLEARLLTGNAKPISSELVEFTSDLVTFSPSNGVALTDSDGYASITLLSNSLFGAGSISATVPLVGETLTVTINITVLESDSVESNSEEGYLLSLSLSSDDSISNTIRANTPGTLNITLTDNNGDPVGNRIMQLSTDLGIIEPSSGLALTDINGDATLRIITSSTLGAGTVTATLIGDANTISTLNFQALAPSIRLGNTNNSIFREGEVGFEIIPVSDNQTTLIFLDIVDSAGAPYTEPLTAALTSRCLENEDSELDASASFVDGRASARYTSINCRPSDIITATLNYGGTTFTAFGELIINDGNSLPDGSAVSVSMTSNDSSDNTIRADAPGTVTATVLDNDNEPVANVIVSFTTTSLANFNPTSGLVLTDTTGQATIEMLAGDTTGADTLTVTVEDSLTTTLNYAITSPEIKIGSGSGVSFSTESLDINVSPLSAGGTTTVTATIVDGGNVLYSTPLDISFGSNCVTSGLARIDASKTTVNGSAQTTYRAIGCEGLDIITASANLGGATFTATGSLTVNTDSAGSLEFTSALPTELAIAGTGGQGLSEQSTVTFRARGSQGLPLANQTINFSLTSSVGGISFSPTSATTDSDGLASTVVRSGTVATAVGVIAQIAGTSIATQSDLLTVTTGVPDQNSISFSASTYNAEAWDVDGTQVTLNAYLADYFNNPVPDGTAITFTTEGGSVDGTCSTTSGSCNVTWTSQSPRPNDGRATILMSAIGNESFSDNNGNGVFDDGDTLGGNDLPEAFLDLNDSSTRDVGESFIDFNNNSTYDAADGLYNGTPCRHSTDCSVTTNTAIRDSIVLTMSGSYPTMVITTTGGVGGTNIGTVFNLSDTVSSTMVIGNASFISFDISIADENGNRLPAGTSITLESKNGVFIGPDTVTVPNTEDLTATPTLVSVRLDSDGDPSTDLFNIEVETPLGIKTTQSIYVAD